MHPKELVKKVFQEKFGSTPTFIARAPGRVNLLGEHVDYNDGFVLPAAIDRATYVAFSASDNDESTLVAADFGESVVFTPATISTKTQIDGTPMPEWVTYPAGMMWAFSQAGFQAPAIRAVFSSDVPRGSGLSSSASVEMAFGVAWRQLAGWNQLPMELALLGQKAEVNYVGVNCGVMDQFASACGQADKLLYPDVLIVVADTTIRRKLTSGEYNKRHDACEAAVKLLKEDLPGITALRDVNIDDFNRLAVKLPLEVEKRARHVVEEIERSRQAVPLLESGNFVRFGELMNECHASLRDLYEVSCPQLDVMARVAQGLPGCYGARLTGAGFGGCTVNLVAREQAEAFAKALSAGYESESGLHPEIYICRASAGAGIE